MKTKTKTPDYNLTWYVYRHNINKNQIYQYNIFDHGRFSEEVYELINKRGITYEDFSEKLRCSLMYYFWCKAEHEIVITSFPPYIDKKEFDRLSSEEFRILSNVRLRCGEKIDIYAQVRMNWDVFVDYVWSSNKRGSKNDTNGIKKTTKKGTYLKIDPAYDDFGAMLNWAVRYCLGRETYAPSMTIQFITPLIPYLNDKTLWCFDRDIEDHQKHGKSFGMDFDEKAWMRFWKEVKDEIQRRDEMKDGCS